MLEVLRRSQRWLMGAVVFLVGGVFVAYLGLGGPMASGPATGAVVELDGRRYTLQDVQRSRERQEARLRESLGDAFDAAGASSYLDQMAAESLIQRAVLASEAEQLGLRATDDEIRHVVRNYFRTPEGTIDAAAAREFGERQFGSERRFASEIRDDILTTKLLQLIDAGVEVSDAEVRDALRYQREAVKLALVVLDPARPAADVEIDDAQVEALLADEAPRVHTFYDEHPERFKQPERVRARHLLLRVPPGASEEEVAAVRARAEAALARIRGGEDFAAVASETSEDPGSKAQGGDLGFFARGQMVPPFEEVAFSLEPGKVSEVVKTDFGFHVIRVEERKAAEERSFDDAAREIAEELVREDRARELVGEQAAALAEAVRGGKTLVDAARALGVEIQRPDWITRRPDGFVPGVGAAPELVVAAFALTSEQPTSPRLFEAGGKKVMVELLERRAPTPEELATDLPAERDRLRDALRAEARNAWLEAARKRLQEEGRLRIDLSPLQQPGAPTETG